MCEISHRDVESANIPMEPPVVEDGRVQVVYGHLGRHSTRMTCPFCEKNILTKTRDRIDGMTIIFVILICLLFWPLFWLPFCMPKCKSVHHYCPQCKSKVGVTDPCT